ncbi:hypothetical protein, partial [Acinetobacter baumannii]|uniref:hypothetical protein n=1 Tax=Acinetobacter baumannii TaxID=470 RepID=UPI001C07A2CB
MNALSHMVDFRQVQANSGDKSVNFTATEIFLSRIKESLTKKMKAEWTTILSVEYLEKLNCWAKLDQLPHVIPYHSDKFTQI